MSRRRQASPAAGSHDAERRLRFRPSQTGPAAAAAAGSRRPWPPHWSPPRVPGRSRSWAGRRPAQQLLAAVRPPRRNRQVAAGHPARGGQQRRPGGGQPAARDRWWPGSGPARTCPSPRSPPPMTTARLARPACSTPPWPMSPTPWPPPPAAATCSRCSPAAAPSCPAPAGPAGARLATRRTLAALRRGRPVRAWAASPRRRSAQPGSPAGSQLHPPRDSRHLRPHRRDVATGRARAPRRTTHTRASPSSGSPPRPAPPWRCWRRAPDRRHSLLAAWSTDSGATGPCRRRCRCTARNSHRLVRARRRRGGDADRQPRADHHRPGARMAATACTATGTATLAPGPAGGWDALAVHSTGSPSGSSRPGPPPGPPRRPSAFPSSSGHRADASTRAAGAAQVQRRGTRRTAAALTGGSAGEAEYLEGDSCEPKC